MTAADPPARESAPLTGQLKPSQLSLPMGMLLLAVTGFVDAYLFIAHGHVFAEAMTGNLVLVGVGTFEPGLVDFWHPLLAFGSFVVGVTVAWSVGRLTGERHVRRTQFVTLVVQVVVLAVVAFLPSSFPNSVVVAVVAYGAGMQIASFNQVGSVKFTTIVMTSNTLHATTTALRGLVGGEADQRRRAAQMYGALAAFVVGVFAGGGATRLQGDRAAIYAAEGYLVVLVLYALRRTPAHEPAA